MIDNCRITRWLENDEKWLLEQKNRIETATDGAKQGKIVDRQVVRKDDRILQQALYLNGYYKENKWVHCPF